MNVMIQDAKPVVWVKWKNRDASTAPCERSGHTMTQFLDKFYLYGGIMNGLNSIVHCRNKEDEAYKALHDSIKAIDYGISDRAGLLKEFDAETIAQKLYDNM